MMVLLDTSFVLACAEFKIDYVEECARLVPGKQELVVLDRTLDELDVLVEKGGARARLARLAKQILLKKQVRVIKTEGKRHVDALILEHAQPGMWVATIDAELKKKLRAKGVSVATVRQKKYVVLE